MTTLKDLDVTTKEVIEIAVPKKKQRVKITITQRHFYDPKKQKVITDQIIHRAKYGMKNDRETAKR